MYDDEREPCSGNTLARLKKYLSLEEARWEKGVTYVYVHIILVI
jgi:hypothetical protein